ncbi:hypothetical protein [Streptomyces sp. NPDC005989]|uniref:hypothetical protein n=1 Tax=Streptomyces sp. NPDC005989 TaxID=3156727 RepID=UPI0033CBE844
MPVTALQQGELPYRDHRFVTEEDGFGYWPYGRAHHPYVRERPAAGKREPGGRGGSGRAEGARERTVKPWAAGCGAEAGRPR